MSKSAPVMPTTEQAKAYAAWQRQLVAQGYQPTAYPRFTDVAGPVVVYGAATAAGDALANIAALGFDP